MFFVFGFPPGALCAPPPFLFLTGKEPNHKKLEVSCEHERKERYTRRSILSSSLRNHKRVQSRVKWAECIASPCIKQGKTIHHKQTVCFRFRSLAIGPTSRGFFIASSLQPFRWKGNRILPLILRNDSYFRSSTRTVHFFYLVILPTTHPMTTDRKWDFPAAERIYSLCSPHTIFLRCFIGVMHRLNRRTEKVLPITFRQDFDFIILISKVHCLQESNELWHNSGSCGIRSFFIQFDLSM